MDIELLKLILEASAGPASGVVVAIGMMVSFGWFLIKHVLPKQDIWIEKALDESKENRKTFQAAVDVMAERLTKIDTNITVVAKDVRSVERDIDDIKKIINKK
jgi:hypothetical protein